MNASGLTGTLSHGDGVTRITANLMPLPDVDSNNIVMEHEKEFKKVPTATPGLYGQHINKMLSSSEAQDDAAVPGSDRCEPLPVGN